MKLGGAGGGGGGGGEAAKGSGSDEVAGVVAPMEAAWQAACTSQRL